MNVKEIVWATNGGGVRSLHFLWRIEGKGEAFLMATGKGGNLVNERENVELVKQVFAAWQRGDIQSVINFYSDDIELQLAGPVEVLPWAGTRRGHEQML